MPNHIITFICTAFGFMLCKVNTLLGCWLGCYVASFVQFEDPLKSYTKTSIGGETSEHWIYSHDLYCYRQGGSSQEEGSLVVIDGCVTGNSMAIHCKWEINCNAHRYHLSFPWGNTLVSLSAAAAASFSGFSHFDGTRGRPAPVRVYVLDIGTIKYECMPLEQDWLWGTVKQDCRAIRREHCLMQVFDTGKNLKYPYARRGSY